MRKLLIGIWRRIRRHRAHVYAWGVTLPFSHDRVGLWVLRTDDGRRLASGSDVRRAGLPAEALAAAAGHSAAVKRGYPERRIDVHWSRPPHHSKAEAAR